MTSEWQFKVTLRNETKNFLNSELCFVWLVYTLTTSNVNQYYLASSNLPFNTETTKKIPSWRENYGEFTYVLRYLTKYTWWKHQPSSASINLHLSFKLLLAIGHLVKSWHLWFLFGIIIDEQSASKTEEKIDHGNVLSQKSGSVAVYRRSLRA